MNALEKVKEIARLFGEHGIEGPAKEAEVLITEALPIDPSELYRGDRELSREEEDALFSLASRRADGEPLQYLLGSVEFYGLKIHVGRGVLIPRPETELLVEETIRLLANRQPPFSILDLCTGSGCIALALAKRFPEAEVYGTDASEAAMVYSIQNALENNIRNVRFLLGDLFGPVRRMRFDCIVSNPLCFEGRDTDPSARSQGFRAGGSTGRRCGRAGLLSYDRQGAPRHLKDKGVLALEIGYGQAAEVEKILRKTGFHTINIVRDFSGIERIVTGIGK
ncbi:MAG: peptide chain release factor N(5)-glutamine methyltransferase [Thermodesulfovibrionales bacterium]